MNSELSRARIIRLGSHSDDRGCVSWLEGPRLPFKVERFYALHEWGADAPRGFHSHASLEQIMIPMAGAIAISTIHETGDCAEFVLSDPNFALYVPPGVWRVLRPLTRGSVLAVLASQRYDESDYTRSFQQFASTWCLPRESSYGLESH